MSAPSFAFEIKPEAHNSMEWNKNPELKREIDKNCEDDTCYKVFSSMPVHEIITAEATKSFCEHYEKTEHFRLWGLFNNECNNLKQDHEYSSNDPLISGVEFNDDPTGIMRRDRPNWLFFLDWIQPSAFEETMEKPQTLTNSSHYGELQFLHAMASFGDEQISLTQKKIVDYVAENFNLAKQIDEKIRTKNFSELEVTRDKIISENDFYSFLSGYRGECKYDDFVEDRIVLPREQMTMFKLFQRCGQFGFGNDPKLDFSKPKDIDKIKEQSRIIGLLSIGSALHVIQDSYSTSHTKRDNQTRKIIKFYHYPNNHYELRPPLHCEHDQFTVQNQDAIQTATEKSRDFLIQFAEMDCDSSEGEANTCKDKIKNWLKTNIFNLEEK